MLLLLAFAAEAAEHVDADRKAGKPLAQSLLVLKREHGGGCQKRHLFAVHYRLERGAHRHFRLAVSDVAAEQTIHRDRRFHVALDVGDRGHLIGRQLVRKRVLEFLLPVRVGGKSMAAHRLSRRVELQQLLGHVAHGLLHARLGLLPGGAAKAIDWRPRRAGVLLDEIEPLDRHEQLVLAGVAQFHELLRRLAHRDVQLLEPDERADAMIDMDHVVADFQIPQIRDEDLSSRPASLRLGRPALFLEDVAFREDRQASFGQPEAAIDLADGDEERGGVRIFGAERRRRNDLILLGELEQALGAARRRRHENGDLAGVTAFANR